MSKIDTDLNWWVYRTLRKGNHIKIMPVVSKYASKLSLDDISKPKDYKHIFHVGVDGKVEGDPTFGGDYRNIPKTEEEEGSSPSRSSSTSGRSDSKTSTPSKSPNKSKKNNKKNISGPVIELSKDTILPPPNGFESGSTVNVPDVVPSVTQQVSSAPPPIPEQLPKKAPIASASPPILAQPPQKAPIAVLTEPEITYTNGTGSRSNHREDSYGDKKDGDLSSFEMGSLLDDMMSVWDSAKLNLGFSDALDPTPEESEDIMEEEDSLLEGEENALCNGNTSLSPPTLSVGTVNPVAVEAVVTNGNGMAESEEKEEGKAVSEEQEESELGAVGGASAAGVSAGVLTTGKSSEGSILSGNIIIKDSMTKPTKTFRKVPRQTPDENGEADDGVAKPENRPQEQSQAPRNRPGRDMNLARQMSREKRWDNEFKRLSSSPKDKSSDNEYIDTETMNKKVDKSSEEYEELALASSPQPYTLRDSVLDSANVMRVPRYADVSRSVSLRTTRPGADSPDSRVEVELNRSQSLREPPISPLGQQAYNSLIGGDISGSTCRTRPEVPERKPPVVPPKPAPKPPSRVKAPDSSGEGRFRNGEARLSGSSSHRSYSGTSSDDGMFEDTNIQVASGDIAGKSGAVASLRQRFNTNQTDDIPPRPPPRELAENKVSSFSGVRLRRREQTNGMNENFYASEPDNNNAFTPNLKFSSTTLQNLEQHMPRRVRRSVGEDRIKRRNSSDASDSDTDVAKTRTERVWSTSSRASEGDSSSDETVGSNRLSTSSTERSSYSETQSSSGYKSPPRSLYDLPEDQTNSTSSRPAQPPSSEGLHSMDHRPPPLPPRVAADSTTSTHRKAPDRPPSGGSDAHWTRPPEAAGHNGDIPHSAVPPPRPLRYDIYDRLPRSRTVDMGEHELDCQKRASQSDYDVLPVRRPVWNQNKSFSVDGADIGDDYMYGSAATIRQLLRQNNVSNNENANNNHDEVVSDADNLEDMPDTSPPPVPTSRKSFLDSTNDEHSSVQLSGKLDTSVSQVQRYSIREPEYVMMKPQSDQDVKREYTQLSSANSKSDYAVPISHNYTSQSNSASPIQNNSSKTHKLSDKDKAFYLLMHPSRSSKQSKNNSSSQKFTRTKSAHLVRRPAFLRAPRTPEQRRGTVSASTRRMDEDGSSSLPRSDRSAGDGHRMRRSRSSDDILKDGDWTMPQEAESLQDLLARAYISPKDHCSTEDPRSGYLVPPAARRKLPSSDAPQVTPSTPPPSTHSSHQIPPSSGYHGEAAYLDMSQNSLERKKKKEQEKSCLNRIDPVQGSSEWSSPSSSPSTKDTAKSVSSSGNRFSHPPASSSNQTKAVPASVNRLSHPPASSANQSKAVSTSGDQFSHPPASSLNQIKAAPSNQAVPQIMSRYVFYDPNDDEVDL